MQGLAGLLESTGVPKTVERLAYGEPLTNLQQANIPALRPETANALMTLLPVPSGANRAAMAAGRAGERMAERVVPQVMGRGGIPAGLLDALSAQTVSPLTVYHGSPAKFNRFDPTKIGSGEGAQAYGYGHYVAQAPDVARDYQRRLAKESQANDLNTRMNLVDVGGTPLSKFNVDVNSDLIDAAKIGKQEFINLANTKKARWEELSSDDTYPFRDYAKQKVSGYTSLLDAAKKSDVDYTGTGMFYEIDLPDEQIARMLDYDKPLSQQTPQVQSNLKSVVDSQMGQGTWEQWIKNNPDYRNLGNDLFETRSPSEVSQLLRESGIPGIRYLDQGSRATPNITNQRLAALYQKHSGNAEAAVDEMMRSIYNTPKKKEEMRKQFLAQIQTPQTSNFVVFPGNEDLLTILRRNGGLLD
jgi:hypothetical protein